MVLLAAVSTIAVQISLMASTGIAVGAWAVLAFSAVAGATSIMLLGSLAAVSRSRSVLRAERAPLRKSMSSPAAVVERVETWTPIPMPKPLYLSRAVMDNVVIEADLAAAELQAAAAEADTRLRAAQATVTPFRRAEPTPKRTLKTLDLDEVLRRRRAAG